MVGRRYLELAVKSPRFRRPIIPFLQIYKNDICTKNKKWVFWELLYKVKKQAPGLQVL